MVLSRPSVMAVCIACAAGAAAQQDGWRVPMAAPPDPPRVPRPASPSPPGRIRFDTKAHDFGRVSDRDELVHRFWFTNVGAGELLIRPSLRGLPAEFARAPEAGQRHFKPGERGSVEVRLNPHGKRGPTEVRYTVVCNDPDLEHEGLSLIVRASVRPTVTFDPAFIDFGEVRVGASVSRTFTVTGDRPDFSVTYLSTTRGRFIEPEVLETTQVEADGERSGRTTLRLTLRGTTLALGEVSGVCTVRTNHSRTWLADLPLRARIMPGPGPAPAAPALQKDLEKAPSAIADPTNDPLVFRPRPVPR